MSEQSESTLAARAVELATRALPGAEVSVEADRHRLALTRFANSVIHQNVAEDVTTVRLRLHRDGRTASGSARISAMKSRPAMGTSSSSPATVTSKTALSRVALLANAL